jgi:phosphoglucomutase
MPGKEGKEKIADLLKSLREDSPEEINGQKVVVIKDYLVSKEYDVVNGEEKTIDLPESNVLQFLLEDDSLVTVRPSGTEPKIKFYFSVRADNNQAADKKLSSLKEAVMELID